ncbi:DUF4781 domain-containing protein [Bradyrhizobium liaoningense]|uniref:DUF4781 domain-containing protein n=1 Tax=Bradyrhizobium liaoningense TaxID=43992 RepID=UPI001BAB4BAE|nr:DUF4781 domain-containing protein [Bradyrhizobium liaoningense]MBR0988383.1 DUF4781 domain-containing protein [Bradyrhizobium liaoningense]
MIDRALDRDFSDIERIVDLFHRDPTQRKVVADVLIGRIVKLQGRTETPDFHPHQQATEFVLPIMRALQDHDDELGALLSRLKPDEARLFADAVCGKERRPTGLLPEARNQILAALNIGPHTEATHEIVTTIHASTRPGDFGLARKLGSNLAIAISREWSPTGDRDAAAMRLKDVLTHSQGGIELLYGGSPFRRQLGLALVAEYPIMSGVLAQGDSPLRIPAATQMAAHRLLRDAAYGDADFEAAQARLADLLKTENGQALVLGGSDEDAIPPAARREALLAFLSDPSMTAADLDDLRINSGLVSRVRRDPWAHPELISRIMQVRAAHIRNDEPTQLSGVDLENIVGAAMGHTPRYPDRAAAAHPIGPEQSHAMLAGKLDLFKHDEGVRLVAAKIRDVGGSDPMVTFLPVTVSSEEFGPVQFPLFRVETSHGSQFVDHMGRSYDDFDDWLKRNKLPPGMMVYPEGGHLQVANSHLKTGLADSLRLGHRPTPESSIGAKIVDKAAFAGGIVAGGLLIVGTGGAAAAVIGVASGVWGTYRAGGELLDRHAHGQTISLADPAARALWFNFAANASGIGAFGGKLAGRLAAGAGAAARSGSVVAALNKTAEIANDAAIINGAIELTRNAGAMTADQLASESLQLVFSAVVSRVAAQKARTAAQSAARLAELRAAIESELTRSAQSHPIEAAHATTRPSAAAGDRPTGDGSGSGGNHPPGSGGDGKSTADGSHASDGKPPSRGGDVIDIDSGRRRRERGPRVNEGHPSAATRPAANGPVRTPSPAELDQLDRLGQAASTAMARATREAETGNGVIRGDVLDSLEAALGALERAIDASDPGGTSPQHRLLVELLGRYQNLPDLANTSALARKIKNELLEAGFVRGADGYYRRPPRETSEPAGASHDAPGSQTTGPDAEAPLPLDVHLELATMMARIERLKARLTDLAPGTEEHANASVELSRLETELQEKGSRAVSPVRADHAAEGPEPASPEPGETRKRYEAIERRLGDPTIPLQERSALLSERDDVISRLGRAVRRLRDERNTPNLSPAEGPANEHKIRAYDAELLAIMTAERRRTGLGREGSRWREADNAVSEYRKGDKFTKLIPPGAVRDAFERAWSDWMQRQQRTTVSRDSFLAAIRRAARSVPELEPQADAIADAFKEALGPLNRNDRLPVGSLDLNPAGSAGAQAPAVRPQGAARGALVTPAPVESVPHDPAQVTTAYRQAALQVARLGQAVQASESDLRAGNVTPQARARHEALVAERDTAVKRLEQLATAYGKIVSGSDPTTNQHAAPEHAPATPERNSDTATAGDARPAAQSLSKLLRQYESANASSGIRNLTPAQRTELRKLAEAEMTAAKKQLNAAEADEKADRQRNGRASPDVEARAKAARGAYAEADINWHKFVEGVELPQSLSMSLAALSAEVDSALAGFNRARELFRRSGERPAEYVEALTRLNRAVNNLFGAWRVRGDGAFASLEDVAKRMHAIAELRSELESGTPLRELEALANAQAQNLRAIDADPRTIKSWEDLAALAHQTSRDWKSAPRDAFMDYVSRLVQRRGQISPRGPLALSGGNSPRKLMADAAARAMMDLEILKRLAAAPPGNASVLAQLGAARQRIDELYRATMAAARGRTPADPAIQQDTAALAILINEYRAQHADLRNAIGEAPPHSADGLLDQAADVTVDQLTELFFPSN